MCNLSKNHLLKSLNSVILNFSSLVSYLVFIGPMSDVAVVFFLSFCLVRPNDANYAMTKSMKKTRGAFKGSCFARKFMRKLSPVAKIKPLLSKIPFESEGETGKEYSTEILKKIGIIPTIQNPNSPEHK